jgi:hypothetical protein
LHELRIVVVLTETDGIVRTRGPQTIHSAMKIAISASDGFHAVKTNVLLCNSMEYMFISRHMVLLLRGKDAIVQEKFELKANEEGVKQTSEVADHYNMSRWTKK